MRREASLLCPMWSLVAALIAMLPTVSIAATPRLLSADWQSRVTPRVQQVLQAAQGSNTTPAKIAGATARFDSNNRLQVDIEFDCAYSAPIASLIAAGMVIGTTANAPPLCVAEGWAAASSIAALASVPNVKRVDLPKYSRSHPPVLPRPGLSGIGAAITSATNGTPALDGNGVAIMHADKYVQQTGKSGASVTIAVISDDATNLAVIQGRGELPASINVVGPSANPSSHPTLTDEGTMMLEEAYAVAPGASLAFCGPETATEYFACVTNLIAAGATVISDDLGFTHFDVMSASTQNAAAQALANLLTANPKVMLFHSAGNDAQDYWQGAYNALSSTGIVCSPSGQAPQTDNFFQQFGANKYLTWQTKGGNPLYLASALPSGQTTRNNIDLYVYNPKTAQVVACSTSANGGTVGSTSYTVINGSAIPGGTYQVMVGTQDASLSGTLLKLIGIGDGADIFAPVTAGAPTSPQDFAAGVVLVGAVFGGDGIGNTIEQFSDTGPIQIVIPSPSTLQAPHLVAPDGIFVDAAGTKFATSGGLFFGTSAASPNAAAIAVLLRSAYPSLTPAQVTAYMQAGAAPLGSSSPNGTFGYGRVDALGALAAIPPPALTGLQGISIVGGGAPAVVSFGVGGTGALAVSTSPSVALTSSGSATVALSPSTCGNPTSSCTLTVTPATGSYGTANIQVVVTDGANRTLSSPVAVVVTRPPPPTISLTSGAMQSVTVNSVIAPVLFTLTGTGALVVTPTASNISGLTITPGCGTTTLTCTANLGTASSTAVTAKLAITVQDAYLQTASATATVSETLPPKSGGGGMDRWTLLVLGCLVLVHADGHRRRRLKA